MALERNLTPLPVGIYWKAVAAHLQPSFDMWVRLSPFVKVLKTVPESDDFSWLLFEVQHPTNMPEQFAFPNKAEKGRATERGDTIDEPPPEKGLLDELPTGKEVADVARTLAWVVGGALIAVLVIPNLGKR